MTLDETNEQVLELKVITLCAQRLADGSFPPPDEAFSSAAHIAFTTTYRFSQLDAVAPFDVPGEVMKLLR